MKSILLIWDRAGHYHMARWRALQSLMSVDTVQLVNLGANDGLYKWESLSSRGVHHLSEKPVENCDFWERFKRFNRLVKQFDVIAVPGYGRLEYLAFLCIARWRKRNVILFAESWYPGNFLTDFLKGVFLRATVDSFFVSGERAAHHFKMRLGIKSERIVMGYSVVDNQHFFSRSNIKTPAKEPYILSVARYSDEKNLELLIRSFRASKLYDRCKLYLIGDGPLKGHLEELVTDDQEKIVLAGWKSYEELPAWYQHAELFVLPSSFEPWGLVVNEALAAGCKVIVSDRCGCIPDFRSVVNVFQYNSLESLTTCLDDAEKLNKPSVAFMDHFSCETWANAILRLSGNT